MAWGGTRPGSGRWSRAELDALAAGATDEAIAAIRSRRIENIRAKRIAMGHREAVQPPDAAAPTELTVIGEAASTPQKRAKRTLGAALRDMVTGVTTEAAPSAPPLIPAEPKIPPQPVVFSKAMVDRAIELSDTMAAAKTHAPEHNPFKLPAFPPGAVPPEKGDRMAMDENISWAGNAWATANGYPPGYLGGSGIQFFPYPYLAELAQRPEYRLISETIADDATRKWIDFEVTGEEERKKKQIDEADNKRGFTDTDPEERKDKVAAAGKTDKVKAIKDELTRLGARDIFYKISVIDGLFGRAHMYYDLGVDLDGDMTDLASPIGDSRDAMSKGKVGKGSLKALRPVEPMWVYPMTYNANNPLKEDWYNPERWWVLGKQVHRSRLPVFVASPVPDLLKPAYSFGGLSRSQMAKPYVDIWLTTRQSIGALIHSFSVMVLLTDQQTILQGQGMESLLARVALFNKLRDNQGTFVLNKATEDFKNVSASLAGLHELQAQAQEHIASVSRIPLVKLTGISPSGLNASSEGEIRVYYDTIAAYQNRFFRFELTRLVNFVQLSLWGEIDPEITFEFEPLWEMSQKEKSDKEKADGERHQIYVDMGAFSPAEIRKIAIDDPTLPYTGLHPEDVPDLREEEEQGLEPEGGRPQPLAEAGPGLGKSPDPAGAGAAKDTDVGSGGATARTGLPWGDQYEWMRGYQLPAATRNGMPVSKLPPAGTAARTQGLRIGSRVRYTPEEGEGGTGRIFGFVEVPNGAPAIGILDLDKDEALFIRESNVTARPVIAADESERGDADALDPFGGDPRFAWDANFNEGDHPRAPDGKFGSGGAGKGSGAGSSAAKSSKSSNSSAALDPANLTKVGEQMGSNPGGVFADASGKKFYVKKGQSPDHVRNELIAAKLYELAGTPTLSYRPVKGDKHIAAEMVKLDKNNASKLSSEEVRQAQEDFVAHAWLANWDAVGLGGDNLGTVGGKATPLDMGGALSYRAQGAPKGSAFGDTVGELKTLRDPNMNPDAAGVFGKMTDEQLKSSAERVTNIPDASVRETVKAMGGDAALADKLIARKQDIAKRFDLATDDAPFEEGKHPRDSGGKFSSSPGGGGSSAPEGGGGEEAKKPDEAAAAAPKPSQTFKSKKEQAAHLLQEGVTTADMLKALGWPSISMPAMAKSLGMKLEKIKKDGVTKYKGTPMTAEEKAEAKTAENAAKQKTETASAAAALVAKQTSQPMPTGNAAEIEKAKKTTPVPLSFLGVPFGSDKNKAAIQKLVDKFNNTYAGKKISHLVLLEGKVAAFKSLQADAMAVLAASQKEGVINEAVAAAKAQALKEAEAKKQGAYAQYAEYRQTPEEAVQFDLLARVKAFPGNGLGQVKYMIDAARKTIKDHNLSITPHEGAFIKAYVASAYGSLNQQLRDGVISETHFNYMIELNKAIDKMPVYKGAVKRGADLTKEQFEKYKEGCIVPEMGFTSTGKKEKLWGSYTYTIHSKTGRDLSSFNPDEGGGEVLFKSGTYFRVHSRTSNSIVLEEV